MDTTAQHPILWRTDDIARFERVTRRTVQRRVADGVGVPPRYDPGGSPYWLADEFVGTGSIGDGPGTGCLHVAASSSGDRGGVSGLPKVASDAPGTVLRMDSSTDHPTLWRCEDVAAFYGRDPRTVQRWVKTGKGIPPRLDPGGRWYWLANEIIAAAIEPPAAMPLPSTSMRRPTAVVGKASR